MAVDEMNTYQVIALYCKRRKLQQITRQMLIKAINYLLKDVERHLPDVDLSRKLHLPPIWASMFPLVKRLEANRANSLSSPIKEQTYIYTTSNSKCLHILAEIRRRKRKKSDNSCHCTTSDSSICNTPKFHS